MKKTKSNYNYFIYKLTSFVSFVIGKLRQNVKFCYPPEIAKLKGPFIVVSNHVGLWDPFLLSHPFRCGVRYITSDAAFRNKLKGWYLSKLGSIPKTKGMQDSATIRGMLNTLKVNGVIGIFPEGDRSYDGTTMELTASTGKILKKMKVPVIAAVHHGTSFSHPRWSSKPNKGRVEYHLQILFTKQQLQELDSNEIQRQLVEALRNDDTAWQQHNLIEYRAGHRAEFIEHPVFICPRCNGIGSFKSKNDDFKCTKCNNTLHVNQHGFFEPAGYQDSAVFDNLRDWLIWQQYYLRKHLPLLAPGAPLFTDECATLWEGHKSDPLQELGTGSAMLTAGGVEFHFDDGRQLNFPATELRGLTVQEGEITEFYHGEHCYQLTFVEPVSALKWIMSLRTIQLLNSKE